MRYLKKIVNTTASSILAAAVLSTPACTKYYYYYCDEGGGQNRIALSSVVEFAAGQRLQDNQIFAGQSLSLFVTRTGSVTDANQLYINNQITSDGAGGFSYRIPMYYPSDGSAVDFYAVHPYASAATLGSPLTFSVQTDQRLQANYLISDLLFGGRDDVSPEAAAIELTFFHRLTKLDFIVTTSSPSIDLSKLTDINVLGTLPQTTIDVETGDITAAAGTAATIRAYADATVAGSVGSQTVTGYTAIIVPQTVPAAQSFIELTIDGQMKYYTPVDPLTFLPGTKYAVTLDVSDTGVTLTSRIEDWTDGGSIGGPAGPR